MNSDPHLPTVWTAWRDAVGWLAAAVLAYLTPAKTIHRHGREDEPPIEEKITPEYLLARVAECRSAAEAVGAEGERIRVSETLSRAERNALKLADEVIALIPDQRAERALWERASAVVGEFYRPRIAEELENAVLLSSHPLTAPLPERQRKVMDALYRRAMTADKL